MGYERDRQDTIAEIARFIPSMPMGDIRAALWNASAAQRESEIGCSIERTERQEKLAEAASGRRDARMAELAARHGVKLEIHGDPRGCPYAFVLPDGREIRIPGRGLPARCFR